MFDELLDAALGAIALAVVLFCFVRLFRRIVHGRWRPDDADLPTESAPKVIGIPPPPKSRLRTLCEALVRGIVARIGDAIVIAIGFAAFEGLRYGGWLVRSEHPFDLWARRVMDGMWGAAGTVVFATAMLLNHRSRSRRRRKKSDEEWAYYRTMMAVLFGLPIYLGGLAGVFYFWNHPPADELGRLGVSALVYVLSTVAVCSALKMAATVDA